MTIITRVGEVKMDKVCGTCKYYDPDDGLCIISGEYQKENDECHALDDDENLFWADWDET